MSKADISIKETGGRNSVPTDRWGVASGQATLIEAGEPIKLGSAILKEQAILLVDADLTVGTDQPMLGVAASDSTDTASAAGNVDFYPSFPDIKWEIKAKSAAAANTQTEIDALLGYLYLIDLTSSVFTIDTAVSATTAAFLIVGGDPNRSTVHFRVRSSACIFDSAYV